MADNDKISEVEIVDNPNPSETEDNQEGRINLPDCLAQAIVADQDFIAQISSAIWANIAPNLNISPGKAAGIDTAMPVGHAEALPPGVSVDQTGSIVDSIESQNPAVSVDRTGAMKRKFNEQTESEGPVKKPRTCTSVAVEPDCQENSSADCLDDEIFSPNSRWEASEELTDFLGTVAKRLNRFERRSLVKAYPRPDVDVVYTPSLDEFLKPFIQGIAGPDKPLKELQDKVLDIFGPLCTVYENLISMMNSIGSASAIELEKDSISAFSMCIKHAMLLAGDVSTHIANNRREAVLKKVNPLLASLANEEFVDTQRQLFGPGFEQRLKARSETAETLGKVARIGKPFFRGTASHGFPRAHGGRQWTTFQTFRPSQSQPRTPLFNRGRATRSRGQFPRFQNPSMFR
jgi:hypothetical protein